MPPGDLRQQVAGRVVFGVADDRHRNPQAFRQGPFGDRLSGVVGTLAMHIRAKLAQHGLRSELLEDDDVIDRLERGDQFCPRFSGEQRPSWALESRDRAVAVNPDHEHVPLLLRSLKIAYVAGVQDIKTPIGERDTATRSAQLNTEFSGSFSRYDLGAHAFRKRTGAKLSTPPPVPRRLKKAPARATLSPKGERVRNISAQIYKM